MKKIYNLTDLCCANCAAEIERDVAKLEEILSCNVNFIMQKMTLELKEEGAADTLKKVEKAVRRVEPDCDLVELKSP